MKKFLITATIVFMAALLFSGIYNPTSPLMWLANTSVTYAYIRGGIIAILLVLLFTDPPRSVHFRLAIGAFSVLLFSIATYLTFNFGMGMTDGLSFVEVAVVCGIEALEMEAVNLKTKWFVARPKQLTQ